MTEENKQKIADQILREGEIYLKETINVTDSLERKAAIFLSVFLSIATALMGIAVKMLSEDNFSSSSFAFFLMLSLGFYTSCYFFIKALKPKGQYLVGNHPKNLIEEMQSDEKYSSVDFAINESKNYQIMIEFNSSNNEDKATQINKGLNTILITVALSFSITLGIIIGSSSCNYWR